jgi:hypothetical protein
MKVYVDDKPVQVLPGATVKHTLIRAGVLEEIERGKKVYDEWGNEVGLDGALSEGMKLSLR